MGGKAKYLLHIWKDKGEKKKAPYISENIAPKANIVSVLQIITIPEIIHELVIVTRAWCYGLPLGESFHSVGKILIEQIS